MKVDMRWLWYAVRDVWWYAVRGVWCAAHRRRGSLLAFLLRVARCGLRCVYAFWSGLRRTVAFCLGVVVSVMSKVPWDAHDEAVAVVAMEEVCLWLREATPALLGGTTC